ncbi:MAG: hypothetical protein BroJett022_10290 [Actinomycetes bacterium]|nr:MAG: hypothetical protein BroJett022_10290 [Actinomycetes bacterium]
MAVSDGRYRIDEHECDFGAALTAMHALLGRRVCVGVRGASSRTREPALLFTGRVERGVELGGLGEGALAIEDGVCGRRRPLALGCSGFRRRARA